MGCGGDQDFLIIVSERLYSNLLEKTDTERSNHFVSPTYSVIAIFLNKILIFVQKIILLKPGSNLLTTFNWK